jgi:type IV secretory pathway VirB2 component (pilin)
MNAFFRFMANGTGRIVRIVAGLLLIVIGILWVQGTVGWILVIIGLVPLLAGAFDKCVFAPLFKLPFDGTQLRQKVK